MKHNVLKIGTMRSVAIVAFLNVNIGMKNNEELDVSLSDVEAMAYEWNNPLDWFEYGLRADKSTQTAPCSQTTTNNNSTTETTISPSESIDLNGTVTVNGIPIGVSGSTNSGSTTTTTNTTTTTTNVPNGQKKTCTTGGDENCDACECC